MADRLNEAKVIKGKHSCGCGLKGHQSFTGAAILKVV